MFRVIVASLFVLSTSYATAQDNTQNMMVVFDASGSMWGQIDGKAKIELARDAFANITQSWSDQKIEAGLIAYGHRRKGDCTDIELIAEPGPTATQSLSSSVNALQPKGKTPLSEAVRMAADVLKYRENRATVILLSDGKETCNADPCAVGTALEEAGIDFTAHVIGFDIADPEDKTQLQCLATNTGGQYLDAKDASALNDALKKVAGLEASTEPEPPSTVSAVIRIAEVEGTSRPTEVTISGQKNGDDERVELGKLSGAGQIITGLPVELELGAWTIFATSPAGAGTTDVTLKGDKTVIDVPFEAASGVFSLLDKGPFLINERITFRLKNEVPLQGNAEYTVNLFPAGASAFKERITWFTRFGSEDGTVEHFFWAENNTEAGDFEIIITRGSYKLDDALQRLPIKIVTNIELTGPSAEAQAEMDAMGGEEPDVAAILEELSSSATHKDPSLDPEVLGVQKQRPTATKGLTAQEHGYEPVAVETTVDTALLWPGGVEDLKQFVFDCRSASCKYDDDELGLSGIPLAGGWAMEEPVILRDGKVSFSLVDLNSGEWLTYNPLRQTDMVSDCVQFLKQGHHSTAEQNIPNPDMICAPKDANGRTVAAVEAIEFWATQRNTKLNP